MVNNKNTHKNQGFTIVELLIVIVVIGVLAAVSFIGYTNIAARAKDSAREATTKQIEKKLLANEVVNGSVLTGKVMDPSDVTKEEFLQEQDLSSLGDDEVVLYGSYNRGSIHKSFAFDTAGDYRKTTYSGSKEIYEYDKDKVFVSFDITAYTTLTWPWDGKTDPVTEVRLSRWSHKDSEWKVVRILRYDSNTSRNEIIDSSRCAPYGVDCDYDPDEVFN